MTDEEREAEAARSRARMQRLAELLRQHTKAELLRMAYAGGLVRHNSPEKWRKDEIASAVVDNESLCGRTGRTVGGGFGGEGSRPGGEGRRGAPVGWGRGRGNEVRQRQVRQVGASSLGEFGLSLGGGQRAEPPGRLGLVHGGVALALGSLQVLLQAAGAGGPCPPYSAELYGGGLVGHVRRTR
ncbi:hypothetical protein ACFT8W_17355 [Streptomyces hygroscopicus]|uniref:hypothetical protein n=1 Tax=Streptomyces hygroscopicus TaxID=1912 RepID=UPI003632A79E